VHVSICRWTAIKGSARSLRVRALNQTNYTPMLTSLFRRGFGSIRSITRTITGTFQALDSNFKVKIPLHPFLGLWRGAGKWRSTQLGGSPRSLRQYGCSRSLSRQYSLFAGEHTSALLYFGDGHAAMEMARLQARRLKCPCARACASTFEREAGAMPRFENADRIMTAGIYRPVDDALRIAYTELINWIHADYGLSEQDAYQLLSQVGRAHLTEMVDPNYVVIASIEKKYLPPKKEAAH